MVTLASTRRCGSSSWRESPSSVTAASSPTSSTAGRRAANTFSVSGATLRARNQQLVSAIAEAAATYRADVLVVGFDQQRMTQGRFHRSLREQLTEATNVPVIVPPRVAGHRAPTPTPSRPAIELGPAPGVRVPDAARALAHV